MTSRVLVVDDLLPNLKLLEARLSAEYFEVLTAANGIDALKICANGDCDIVLLDVMMPGMDGLEVRQLSLLRCESPLQHEVEIIAVS
jgi:two-component system, cell cycle response regulator